MPTTITRQGELLNSLELTSDPATSQGFVFNNATAAALLIDTLSVGAGVQVTISYYIKADASLPTTYQLASTADAPVAHVTQQGRCITLSEAQFFPMRYVIPVLSTGTGTVRVCLKG